MEIGDRVYHTGVRANGQIIDIRGEEYKDRLKVKFFWAKYSEAIPHGRWRGSRWHDRKWMFTRPEMLVKTDWIENGSTVGLTGKRSLEALIRNVAEIPRYSRGMDIAINYGGGSRGVSPTTFVINQSPVWDKFQQMRLMGDLVQESFEPINNTPLANAENWIIKPKRSIGGKNIRPALGDTPRAGEYYQRRFDKIREIRAHCFMWLDNKVPLIQEKAIGDRDQLCWNKKQGGNFRYVYQEGIDEGKYMGGLVGNLKERIQGVSIEACQKLGYDMGGVDVGMNEAGDLKIFEVNSRMGLREQSLFTYKRAFNSLRGLNINDYIEERER